MNVNKISCWSSSRQIFFSWTDGRILLGRKNLVRWSEESFPVGSESFEMVRRILLGRKNLARWSEESFSVGRIFWDGRKTRILLGWKNLARWSEESLFADLEFKYLFSVGRIFFSLVYFIANRNYARLNEL